MTATTYRFITLIVLGFLTLGVALNFGSDLLFSERDPETLAHMFAALIPSIFFAAAIWSTAQAFRALDTGENAEITLANLVERVGACLTLGALASVFGKPLLLKVLSDSAPLMWFDPAAITLGCVGILLLLLGRPLRVAADRRAELADFL